MGCCKPSQYDEDRTHTVRYHQAYYRGEPGMPPVWEESGTLTISCTHNDAIADAALRAQSWNGYAPMKPRGHQGRWMASEVLEGEGEKAEIWISRGPAEEDYDKARAEQEAAEARL